MAIIKCPECGHQISEKATICPSCGVEIAGKIAKCLYCGEVFFKNDGLCPHCYRPYHNNEDDITPVDKDEKNEISQPPHTAENTEDITIEPTSIDNDKTVIEEEEAVEIDEQDSDQVSPSEETGIESAENEDTSELNEDEEEVLPYVDIDEENLKKPEQEISSLEETSKGKHPYIPIIVSLAITALIVAVCFYFYNDSKMSRETEAFELAMKSNDVNQLKNFLRNYTDASSEHKTAVEKEISLINKQEEDLSMSLVTRDKARLAKYLEDYPGTPHKQKIISIIDSLDWEEAQRKNTKEAYDLYIAEHPSGNFLKEAKDKVTVKELAATAEDDAMAKTLFREFFLSVNGNDAGRISPTLNSSITDFMGTENAKISDVIGWMNRQHGEDVSNVIWKLNHDYKITKREQGGECEYGIVFTAKQTIIHRDGRASSENYKISSKVTNSKKISSMTMVKYTPQAQTQAPSTSNNKPAPSQKETSQSNSKPTTTNADKTKASNQPKPTTSSNSAPKPSVQKSNNQQKQSSKPENKTTQSNSATSSKK